MLYIIIIRRLYFCLYQRVICVSVQFQQFIGNTDNDTVKEHELEPMVTARFIRFVPTIWNYRMCMRVEIYECLPVKGTHMLCLSQYITPKTAPAYTVGYANKEDS